MTATRRPQQLPDVPVEETKNRESSSDLVAWSSRLFLDLVLLTNASRPTLLSQRAEALLGAPIRACRP